jgi:hypothetical protein
MARRPVLAGASETARYLPDAGTTRHQCPRPSNGRRRRGPQLDAAARSSRAPAVASERRRRDPPSSLS